MLGTISSCVVLSNADKCNGYIFRIIYMIDFDPTKRLPKPTKLAFGRLEHFTLFPCDSCLPE